MSSKNANPLPRVLDYLPGIFQTHGSKPNHPLWAFLSIIDAFIGGVEERLERLPDEFDPDTAKLSGDAGSDFLSWLAHWVALSLDRDLLAECIPADDSNDSEQEEAAIKARRWRRLIKDAARLYDLRGTPLGLRYMVETFYEVRVELLERAWPQGMVIGLASTIGKQTFIVDPPDLSRSFIILIKLTDEERKTIEASGEWLNVPYTAENVARNGRLLACSGGKPAQIEALPLLKKLRKIKQLLDQERPIHTQSFIAFQGRMPQVAEPPVYPDLVVGVQSIIEDFIITGE